jgi:endonuclease VIII
MPEGDTLHRAAAKLRPALVGQRIVALECDLAAADDWQLEGREIVQVEARGKNLLIHCAPRVAVDEQTRPDPRRPEQLPVAIWTHLGMRGAWRLYERGAWSQVARAATLAVHTQTHVAACFAPKQLALLGPRALLRHPMLASLGPDLIEPDSDLDEAVARLRALASVELGDAIMRQSAVAGIGNVYKSELLFLARQDPFVAVGTVAPERLRALLERAGELMRLNVERGGPRRTRFAADPRARLWVYERSGRPCRRCGATIRMRRQGALARSTYFCPRCQGAEA